MGLIIAPPPTKPGGLQPPAKENEKMKGYGVERNGEHGKIFDTREEADRYIVEQVLFDHNAEGVGWIPEGSADNIRYRIVDLKKRRVW